MLKDKKMMTVSFVLVIAVVAILVYITINHKEKPVYDAPQANQDSGVNTNMQQPQQELEKETSVGKVSTIGGVKITILSDGNGNPVKSGDTVAMNYTGKLVNGTVFDSNIDPKFNHVEPFVFELGKGSVIKGWDVGVVGMKLGEKRKLEISPDYGYGAAGAGGGAIPPNATLIFEVQLVGIKQ